MKPMVSILWLNYNSKKHINLIKESLRRISDLDYPNYELIIVDNGSTDGSYKIIKGYAEKLKIPQLKIIKLDKNLGFCGGNNIAFKARDPNSKYVVLLNNDAIPYPDSLRALVERMESDYSLGSAQGVILDYEHGYIDTAGYFIDELLLCHAYLHGLPPSIVKKDRYITYADGSYSIYRVDAIKRVNNEEKMFMDEFFAYFDDSILGLQMWNKGYKIKMFPFIAGKHRRSTTFNVYKPLQLYLYIRNHIVLHNLSNSRYKGLINLLFIRKYIVDMLKANSYGKSGYVIAKALRDAYKLSKKLKQQGFFIDLYKAPIIKLDPLDAIKGLFLRRILTEMINREK